MEHKEYQIAKDCLEETFAYYEFLKVARIEKNKTFKLWWGEIKKEEDNEKGQEDKKKETDEKSLKEAKGNPESKA